MESNIKKLFHHLFYEPGDLNYEQWLEKALEIKDLLIQCQNGREIILHFMAPRLAIKSFLVPTNAVIKPDHIDLSRVKFWTPNSWQIVQTYNENKFEDIFLESYQKNVGCESLINGDIIVYKRLFEGVDSYKPSLEISQKITHALELYFLDERNAYCRLDSKGDIEKIIRFFEIEMPGVNDDIPGVCIQRSRLEYYMAISGTSLVTKFEHHRRAHNDLCNWSTQRQFDIENSDLFLRSGIISKQASYAYGHTIFRTNLTKNNLINSLNTKENSEKQYVTFKIYDFKNKCNVEISCGPDSTSNYYMDSDLPFEMSPAFFQPSVLQKYKSDPEKYKITDRSIDCRNAWHLDTYDTNEAGQVHTYLRYLSALPYEEQLYWKSFNEWPKGSISNRAMENDFLGEFSSEIGPLHELKLLVKKLDEMPPFWWKSRRDVQYTKLLYPTDDLIPDWRDMIEEFHKLIIEGLSERRLKNYLNSINIPYDNNLRSLKLLEIVLNQKNAKSEELLLSLRELNHLRTFTSHDDKRDKLDYVIKQARSSHGKLNNHFKDLVHRVYKSLEDINSILQE